jgi:hypothetical protein
LETFGIDFGNSLYIDILQGLELICLGISTGFFIQYFIEGNLDYRLVITGQAG